MEKVPEFALTENGNPNYKEDQKLLIDNLNSHVGPADEILPDDLYGIIESNLNATGNVIAESEGKRIALYKNNNDTLVIQRAHALGPEGENYLIDDYYIVDLKAGNAFDASILWNTNNSTKLLEEDRPSLNDGSATPMIKKEGKIPAHFAVNRNGGELVFNRFNKNQKYINSLDFVNNLTIFHETGHKFQYDRYSTNAANNLGVLLAVEAISKYPMLKGLIELKKGLKEALRLEKQYTKERERNASAFALNTIKRLKELGVDVTRGLTTQEIFVAVDFGLTTYDFKFKNVNGPSISQTERRMERIAGNYPKKRKELEEKLIKLGL